MDSRISSPSFGSGANSRNSFSSLQLSFAIAVLTAVFASADKTIAAKQTGCKRVYREREGIKWPCTWVERRVWLAHFVCCVFVCVCVQRRFCSHCFNIVVSSFSLEQLGRIPATNNDEYRSVWFISFQLKRILFRCMYPSRKSWSRSRKAVSSEVKFRCENVKGIEGGVCTWSNDVFPLFEMPIIGIVYLLCKFLSVENVSLRIIYPVGSVE